MTGGEKKRRREGEKKRRRGEGERGGEEKMR